MVKPDECRVCGEQDKTLLIVNHRRPSGVGRICQTCRRDEQRLWRRTMRGRLLSRALVIAQRNGRKREREALGVGSMAPCEHCRNAFLKTDVRRRYCCASCRAMASKIRARKGTA